MSAPGSVGSPSIVGASSLAPSVSSAVLPNSPAAAGLAWAKAEALADPAAGAAPWAPVGAPNSAASMASKAAPPLGVPPTDAPGRPGMAGVETAGTGAGMQKAL